MATPYSSVYDFFLTKVEDFSFIDPDVYATEQELHDELKKYLRSSVVRFKQCKQNLGDKDDVSNQFNLTLTDEEQEILASLMVISYITPKIISTQNMEQRMSDREYKSYSQGKHLQEMINLKKEMQLEVSYLISSYTTNDGLTGLF